MGKRRGGDELGTCGERLDRVCSHKFGPGGDVERLAVRCGYMDRWMGKMDVWAKKDRDFTIKVDLEKKGMENKLEGCLKEKIGKVEVG